MTVQLLVRPVSIGVGVSQREFQHNLVAKQGVWETISDTAWSSARIRLVDQGEQGRRSKIGEALKMDWGEPDSDAKYRLETHQHSFL